MERATLSLGPGQLFFGTAMPVAEVSPVLLRAGVKALALSRGGFLEEMVYCQC